jgi:hypothetical protein
MGEQADAQEQEFWLFGYGWVTGVWGGLWK